MTPMSTPALHTVEVPGGMLTKPTRTARYYYLKLIRLRGEPAYLAKGVAIGVFIGITPTIPLHTALILSLAFLLRASKISSLLTSWLVSNPLTFFAQYYISWRLGNLLMPGSLSWHKISQILKIIEQGTGFLEIIHQLATLGAKAIFAMVMGGSLVALPISVVSYFLSLNFFRKMAARRKRRQAQVKADEKPPGP
jgi:uncharacterized protein (DUF2062 family)